MGKHRTRKQMRMKRHVRVRMSISGSPECPRLSVCFTGKHIYAQFIDDSSGRTLASVSSADGTFRSAGKKNNLEGAKVLGKMAAEKAVAAGINSVVFDRGGFKYHGKVKAFADSAREGGLKF